MPARTEEILCWCTLQKWGHECKAGGQFNLVWCGKEDCKKDAARRRGHWVTGNTGGIACLEKGRMRAICRQQHWERDHFPHLPRQPQQHADHSEVNTFDPSEQFPKCLWCFQPCTLETGQRISCRFCEQGPFHAVCWMRHYNTTHNHFHQPGAEMPIMEEQQPPCHTQSQLPLGLPLQFPHPQQAATAARFASSQK